MLMQILSQMNDLGGRVGDELVSKVMDFWDDPWPKKVGDLCLALGVAVVIPGIAAPLCASLVCNAAETPMGQVLLVIGTALAVEVCIIFAGEIGVVLVTLQIAAWTRRILERAREKKLERRLSKCLPELIPA